MDMDALQARIGEWASKTYPNSTLDSKIAHLHREVEELRTEDPLEIADCVMILMHEAHRRGLSIADLIEKKFAICQKRKLAAPDAQGVVEHIRE